MTNKSNDTSKGSDTHNRRRFLKGTGAAAGGVALATLASQSVAADHLTTPIGEDVTFTDMNRDRTGHEIDQDLSVYRGGSRAEPDHDQAWARAEGDAGRGTARYYAAVGRKFIAEGNDPQEAVLGLRGRINGYLEGALEGGASVVVILSLVDFTEQTTERARPRPRLERTGVQGTENVDTAVQTSLETTIRPDHEYIAWANLHARVDLGLDDPQQTIQADFGADHDGLEANEINLTFRQ